MGQRYKMNADHVHPCDMPASSFEEIAVHLNALVSPLVSAQLSSYRN